MRCFWIAIGVMFMCGILAGETDFFLKQGAVIEFDDSNNIRFEDVGRREVGSGGTFFGQEVVLHVTRDGSQYDVGPFFSDGSYTRISSQVKSIQYVDKDHVWIISRLGSRLDGAVLVDLAQKDIVQERRGQGFTLSADKQHLSFVYPVDRENAMVFVDDAMVYPTVDSGYVVEGITGPEKRSGGGVSSALQRGPTISRSALVAPLEWMPDGSLEFIVEEELEANAAGTSATKQVRLGNVSSIVRTADGLTSVSSTIKALGAEEAQRLIQGLIEKHELESMP